MRIHLDLGDEDNVYSLYDILEFLTSLGWDEDQVAEFTVSLVTYWAIADAEWEQIECDVDLFKDMKPIPYEK